MNFILIIVILFNGSTVDNVQNIRFGTLEKCEEVKQMLSEKYKLADMYCTRSY